MKSGIYEIVCTANGRRYIGSSRDLEKRWSEHRRQMERGVHANRHLQNAWVKYGAGAFDWLVLESGVAPENLIEREQSHLDPYESTRRESLFNVRPRARNNLGMVHSDATKAKIADASRRIMAENPHSPERVAQMVEAAATVRRGRKECPRGHAFSPENTYRAADGGRVCRICDRAKHRRLKGFSMDPWDTALHGNGAKTHCKQGHEFLPETTYRKKTGGRQCVICRRASLRAHYARNKPKYAAWQRDRRAQEAAG